MVSLINQAIITCQLSKFVRAGDATKCRTVRGCPARKHVERVMDDPGMLIDTYESDHNGRETPPEPPQ